MSNILDISCLSFLEAFLPIAIFQNQVSEKKVVKLMFAGFRMVDQVVLHFKIRQDRMVK